MSIFPRPKPTPLTVVDKVELTLAEYVRLYFVMPSLDRYGPFTFRGRPYWVDPYESDARSLLLLAGRQTNKSTALGNRLLALSTLRLNFMSLYVSPTETQTKQFSNDRIAVPVRLSKFLRNYTASALKNDVFHRSFTTGSEIRLRYAYHNADRIRGIQTNLLCYDKSAFVLTRAGWKLASEITKEDEVADVNDAGVVEWSKPTQIVRKRHSGKMVSFNNRGCRLRVTGDHNMWVNYKVKVSPKYKTEDKWEFVKAIDLANTTRMGFKMTGAASWQQENFEEVRKFPEWSVVRRASSKRGWSGALDNRVYPGLDVPYQALANLTGWYAAEGHIQKLKPRTGNIAFRPVITQNPGSNLEDIQATVEACGVEFTTQGAKDRKNRAVWVNSKILGDYFRLLGKCRDKHIPREFFARPDLLTGLLERLYRGDGMHHPGDSWDDAVLRTRSRRLAEDTQEAWLRLGRPAAIHTQMIPPREGDPPEPMYHVKAYMRDYYVFWKSEFKSKSRVTVEDVVDEEVYCFTIKNHRPIVKGDFEASPVISGNCIDECQDIVADNLPVIEQTLFTSEVKYRIYAGTPKSETNTLSVLWYESTMNEWLVPCHRHSFAVWNRGDETNIPTHPSIGLACRKCRKSINVCDPMAHWASMNPESKHLVTMEGYRFPQLIAPDVDWADMCHSYKAYPRRQFFNERLGLPCEDASRPITRDQLKAHCDSAASIHVSSNVTRDFTWASHRARSAQYPVWMGVDWGTGEQSYTYVVIGSYFGGTQLRILYFERFVGDLTDPARQIAHIIQLIERFNVTRVGSDYGGGFDRNIKLVEFIGVERLWKYQYANAKKKLYFDPKLGRFIAHRTELMTAVFELMKRGRFTLPRWEDCEGKGNLGEEILAIHTELDKNGTMHYSRAPKQTDDGFHALLYMTLVSLFDHPMMDLIIPGVAHHDPELDEAADVERSSF